MARPQTKQELLDAAASSHQRLLALIGAMRPEQLEQDFPFEDRDRNVRDVLVHLHEWHMLLLAWVEANIAGEPASFLPPGYTWASYADMNVGFRDQHAHTSVDAAEILYIDSRAQVRALVEAFTDEELFTERHFPWTGTTSLAAYCISATSSHDEGAITKLRKATR